MFVIVGILVACLILTALFVAAIPARPKAKTAKKDTAVFDDEQILSELLLEMELDDFEAEDSDSPP